MFIFMRDLEKKCLLSKLFEKIKYMQFFNFNYNFNNFSLFMREISNLYDNKSNFRFSKNAYINKMKFIIR